MHDNHHFNLIQLNQFIIIPRCLRSATRSFVTDCRIDTRKQILYAGDCDYCVRHVKICMRKIRRDLRDLLVGWSGFRCGGVRHHAAFPDSPCTRAESLHLHSTFLPPPNQALMLWFFCCITAKQTLPGPSFISFHQSWCHAKVMRWIPW